MMTRKTFVAMASQLKSVRPADGKGREAMYAWEACVRSVATVCQQNNPAFDWNRFVKVCGFDGK
jgi:hypothetical protein